jgi:hypothetical protein
MARGNKIIVSANPRGVFMEGYISGAVKPGTICQADASVALKGGRHTFKVYQPGTDGEMPVGPYYILLEDSRQGRSAADAYVSGDRCFLYTPIAGEELNLLLADVAGTGDDHALGEKLMVDTGTGKLIATTGTPESEVAQLLEVITDPTADTLAWCLWSGL